MITCETPHRMWTIEGKIEDLPGTYGGEGAHVGIEDLSSLLAEHQGKWAKIRVELIEGPRLSPVEEAEIRGYERGLEEARSEVRTTIEALGETRDLEGADARKLARGALETTERAIRQLKRKGPVRT